MFPKEVRRARGALGREQDRGRSTSEDSGRKKPTADSPGGTGAPAAAVRAGRVAIVVALGACAALVAGVLGGVRWRAQSDAPASAPAAAVSFGGREAGSLAASEAVVLLEPTPEDLAGPAEALEGSRSGLAVPVRTPTRLDGVVDAFLAERPDPLGLQNELRRIVASASVLPATVRKAKDGSMEGELSLPELGGRGRFYIRGASYRVELPVLEHLGAELAERRLTLNFAEIDGQAKGVIVDLRFRPRPGEAFDAYLAERGAGTVATGWQISFSPSGIKATQAGAVQRGKDGGPWTTQRGGGRNAPVQLAGAWDPAVFDAWLASLRGARP